MDRCFIVQPKDAEMHLPTDLLGFQSGTFMPRQDGNLLSALGPTTNRIRQAIKKLGPRRPQESAHKKNDASPSSKKDRLSSFVDERNLIVATRAQRKDLVKRILNGETVKEVEQDGRKYHIGDRLPVPSWRWVTVMNFDGVSNANIKHEFGDSCGIDEKGNVEILGFNQSEVGDWWVLLKYHTSSECAGTECGNGVMFFRPL